MNRSVLRQHFIGMSMGGTKLYAALYKREPAGVPRAIATRTVLWKNALLLTDQRDVADPSKVSPDRIVAHIATTVEDLLSSTGITLDGIANIGCTSPGPLDRLSGIIGTPCKTFNMPFEGYPFVGRLRDRLKCERIEIRHDSHSGIEGEIALGLLRGVENGLYIIQGTGLGGSVSKGGRYFDRHPELTEPGHHTVGTPYGSDKFCHHFRFIPTGGKDHPREVVGQKDGSHSYQISPQEAAALIGAGKTDKRNLIWAIEGEKDLEELVAGVALEPLLRDKGRLARQFGGTSADYACYNEPKDLSVLAREGTDGERTRAIPIIAYIGGQMGRALASIIALSRGTEWELRRIVIGSTIGENLGLGLIDADGSDLYYSCIRAAARHELAEHFGFDAEKSAAISKEIYRSTLSQELRETAGFDRQE